MNHFPRLLSSTNIPKGCIRTKTSDSMKINYQLDKHPSQSISDSLRVKVVVVNRYMSSKHKEILQFPQVELPRRTE